VGSSPHCLQHPDVPGIALCVLCGTVLCGACATRIQGRNLCAVCLAAELTSAEEAPGASSLHRALVLGAVVFGGLVVMAVIAGLGVALHALG
jgi:hypothetical protein